DSKPATDSSGRPVWSEKKISFEMSNKPWPGVLSFLADQTGLPFIGTTAPPSGAFSFVNPKDEKGKPVQFTLVEVFDIINEALQTEKKFTILRRKSVLQLYPADEIPPDSFVDLVSADELKDRGKTEIVRMLYTLKQGNVSEIAPDVKRMLGDFGHVTPIE